MCRTCYQRAWDLRPERQAYYRGRLKYGSAAAYREGRYEYTAERRARLLAILRLADRIGIAESDGWVPGGRLRALHRVVGTNPNGVTTDLRWLIAAGLVERTDRPRGHFAYRAIPGEQAHAA